MLLKTFGPRSSRSQRFDVNDELHVSLIGDINTSLVNPNSDPLQASVHYAAVSYVV